MKCFLTVQKHIHTIDNVAHETSLICCNSMFHKYFYYLQCKTFPNWKFSDKGRTLGKYSALFSWNILQTGILIIFDTNMIVQELSRE